MLMITEQHDADGVIFKLAGALAGDWAIEFERCWRRTTGSNGASHIVIDLAEVTFVDEIGKVLLSLMVKSGAELLAHDILMKSIAEEIAQESSVARIQ
jgi:anti-anti-sigma regulatory factor